MFTSNKNCHCKVLYDWIIIHRFLDWGIVCRFYLAEKWHVRWPLLSASNRRLARPMPMMLLHQNLNSVETGTTTSHISLRIPKTFSSLLVCDKVVVLVHKNPKTFSKHIYDTSTGNKRETKRVQYLPRAASSRVYLSLSLGLSWQKHAVSVISGLWDSGGWNPTPYTRQI